MTLPFEHFKEACKVLFYINKLSLCLTYISLALHNLSMWFDSIHQASFIINMFFNNTPKFDITIRDLGELVIMQTEYLVSRMLFWKDLVQ
jgi:hypothetical protein